VLVRVEEEEEVRDKIGGDLVNYMLAWPDSRRTIHFVGTKVRIGLFFGRLDFGFVLDIDSTAILKVMRVNLVDLPSADAPLEAYL
jgi:hypothetical protein